MSGRHEGEVVVVAGAGGIGCALARLYADEKAALVLLDKSEEALLGAKAELAPHTTTLQTMACDLTQPQDCAQVVGAISERFGRIDVLAHCAGLTQISPFAETEMSVLRRVMDINLFGPMQLTQAALPFLIETRGRIIALSSLAGVGPLVGRTGYCASKYALHGFLETLRAELVEAGVSVTIACPSYVDTGFTRKGLRGDGGVLNRTRKTADKLLAPEDVAVAVYRGASRRRQLVLVSIRDRLAVWIARLFPAFYARQMRRRYGVELEGSTPG